MPMSDEEYEEYEKSTTPEQRERELREALGILVAAAEREDRRERKDHKRSIDKQHLEDYTQAVQGRNDARRALEEAQARIEVMTAALVQVRDTFEARGRLHRKSKNLPRAVSNESWAALLNEAIHWRPPEPEPEPVAETPWYPPQQEGFGPWIEGLPSQTPAKPYQLLAEYERETKFYTRAIFEGRQLIQINRYVAHCVRL